MAKQAKTIQPYTVWCIRCGRKMACEGETSREAAEFTRRRGWVSGAHEGFCPECEARSARR